jgi:predicted dehydrogenase
LQEKDMDKVRIGIIGTGQIGKHHIRSYQPIPEAEIVAVADLRGDEAERVAAEFSIPHVYTDYHELLQRDDIDCVDVCLHNRFHMPVTLDALAAGKNVYCEKPMSWTYQEAQRMVDAAQDAGKMLHIQLSTLYSAETRATKRLIDEGYLGDIYYAKSCNYRRRGRPWVDGYGTPAFVNTGTSGGGAMLDMAVYHIARMLYLLGNPAIVSVSGQTFQKLDNIYPDRRQSGNYDVEELGTGIIRLANGVLFFMEEAWAIHSEAKNKNWVYGSKGGVLIDPFTYYTTLGDMEMDGTFDLKQADWRWHQCDATTTYFSDSQRHWVAAQLGRVALLNTAGIALNTAFITEGIYVSGHLGREVTAEELRDASPGFGRV